MIRVEIGSQEILLPGDWQEVTVKQWAAVQKGWDGSDYLDLLCLLSGSERIKLSSQVEIAEKLAPHLDYLRTPETMELSDLEGYVTIEGRPREVPYEIRDMPYRVKMYLQQYATQAEQNDWIFSELIPFYLALIFYDQEPWTLQAVNKYQEITEQLPYLQAEVLAKYYHSQLIEIIKHEGKVLKSNYTQEERRAGVDRFNKYGAWPAMYTLAGSILNIDRVISLPYQDIFLTLRYEHDKANYQRKLNEVMQPKKKR